MTRVFTCVICRRCVGEPLTLYVTCRCGTREPLTCITEKGFEFTLIQIGTAVREELIASHINIYNLNTFPDISFDYLGMVF